MINTSRWSRAAAAAAVTLAVSPAFAQDSPWAEAAKKSTGEIADNLAKAFPDLAAHDSADFAPFVTALKAAGIGKPAPQGQAPPGAAEGNIETGRAIAKELFAAADKDGDGVILVEQLPHEMAERVESAEEAKDGKLTTEELATALLAARRRELTAGNTGGRGPGGGGGRGGRGGMNNAEADTAFAASLDANRDGKVSRDELKQAVEALLVKALERPASMDTDLDGSISKKEYAISMPPKFGEIDADGMDGHARGHFKQEDKDEDGKLSVEEVATPALARVANRVRNLRLAVVLASADTNGDGKLSVEEIQARVSGEATPGEGAWKALGFANGDVAVDTLYHALSRLPQPEAEELVKALG